MPVSTSPLENVILRHPRATDQSYVICTWIQSLRSEIYGRQKAPKTWLSQAGTEIDRLLDKAGVNLLIASDKDNTDRVAGWLAYSIIPGAQILLYVYVRNEYREMNLSKMLFEKAGFTRSKPILYLYDGPMSGKLSSKANLVKIDPGEFLK